MSNDRFDMTDHKTELGYLYYRDPEGLVVFHDGDGAILSQNDLVGMIEPTHYAVVDEHGEIVFSRRCGNEPEQARKGCDRYLHLMAREHITGESKAKNWTVKEVTLHD